LKGTISVDIYNHYIIYKTIHTSGKYYIGRHCTNNINDGYLGSGLWVKSIKDKSTLSIDILDSSASNLTELKLLESSYIQQCFDDPLNMNWTKSSCGYDSDSSSAVQKTRIENNTHHFITDNPSVKRCENGTHHWLGGEFQKQVQRSRIADRSHNFLGGELQKERIKNGTHHFVNNHPSKNILVCPYCNKSVGKNNYTRWHGDNCKLRLF
jgi:hypothetical protein